MDKLQDLKGLYQYDTDKNLESESNYKPLIEENNSRLSRIQNSINNYLLNDKYHNNWNITMKILLCFLGSSIMILICVMIYFTLTGQL
jgi:hypothetical protein